MSGRGSGGPFGDTLFRTPIGQHPADSGGANPQAAGRPTKGKGAGLQVGAHLWPPSPDLGALFGTRAAEGASLAPRPGPSRL